ncbi:MAG: SMI1/KNR4 family protein [Actinomycetota bacterium]
MDELVRRLQERILRSPAIECDAWCGRCNEAGESLPPRPPRPPVPPEQVDAFEREFGFQLPTLVRRLYTEVANGGYGPNWGIIRLWSPPGADFERWWEQPMSVEAWLRFYRQEREKNEPPGYWRHWPEPSIRFCEVGCNISICVDCATDQGRVFMDDPNRGEDPRDCFLPVADSVEEWLLEWLEKPWPEEKYP